MDKLEGIVCRKSNTNPLGVCYIEFEENLIGLLKRGQMINGADEGKFRWAFVKQKDDIVLFQNDLEAILNHVTRMNSAEED